MAAFTASAPSTELRCAAAGMTTNCAPGIRSAFPPSGKANFPIFLPRKASEFLSDRPRPWCARTAQELPYNLKSIIVSINFFLYRRIRWIIAIFSKKEDAPVRLLASLRNLLLITVRISVFRMVRFLGCFFRAYHAFTIEEPVAEVFTRSLDVASHPL